jgi:hypothetical protein
MVREIIINFDVTAHLRQSAAVGLNESVTLRQCDIFAAEAATTCGSAAATCGTFTVPIIF